MYCSVKFNSYNDTAEEKLEILRIREKIKSTKTEKSNCSTISPLSLMKKV